MTIQTLGYRAQFTRQFKKSHAKHLRTGHKKASRVDMVIEQLLRREPLPAHYCDHALDRRWHGHRDCHLGGDFLILYRVCDDTNTVFFVDVGTHGQLFA